MNRGGWRYFWSPLAAKRDLEARVCHVVPQRDLEARVRGRWRWWARAIRGVFRACWVFIRIERVGW